MAIIAAIFPFVVLLWKDGCVRKLPVPVDQVMPPSKVCPKCDTVLPIRLKVCKSCQHVFRAKRKSDNSLPGRAMKQLRVVLSDGVKSAIKTKNKLYQACKRAAESSEQNLRRQQHDRVHKASVRSAESSEQTLRRQLQNKDHMAA